jgi:hypothetical protein
MIRRRVFEAQRPGAATGLVRIRGGPALTTEADVPGVMIRTGTSRHGARPATTRELVPERFLRRRGERSGPEPGARRGRLGEQRQ